MNMTNNPIQFALALRELELFGGPGSGCSGDNCGRPAGSGETKVSSKYFKLDKFQKYFISEGEASLRSVSIKDVVMTEEGQSAGTVNRAVAFMSRSKVPVIEVEKVGNKYHILEGHHRFLAATKMGEKTIPVLITTREKAEQHWDWSNQKGFAD